MAPACHLPGLSFRGLDDETPHEASDGEYTDEEIFAPTTSVLILTPLENEPNFAGRVFDETLCVPKSYLPIMRSLKRPTMESVSGNAFICCVETR